MPNWVYNNIKVSSISEELFNKISEKGLCDTFLPQPTELQEISNNNTIISQEEYDSWKPSEGLMGQTRKGITQEIHDDLISKYGTTSWYDWSYQTWGTKWGDCDTELERNEDGSVTISYQTAWSPLSDSCISEIMELAGEEIGEMTYYSWEEEGGFGEAICNERGFTSWEEPSWDYDREATNKDGYTYYYLESDYTREFQVYPAGWYEDQVLDEDCYITDESQLTIEEV